MSRKYKFHDNDKLYFISFAVISWVDLFIRNEYKEIIIRSFLHCVQHKSMELYAYCIMTSHVHMIIGSRGEPDAEYNKRLKAAYIRKPTQRNYTAPN